MSAPDEQLIADIGSRTGRDREASMLAALDSVGIAGYEIEDGTARILWASARAASMLGYEPGELEQLRLFDIDPDLGPNGPPAMSKPPVDGFIRFEARHRRKDGTLVPVEVSTQVVLNERGRSGTFYAFAIDITQRKVAEAALNRAREDAERANEQLAEANRELARRAAEISSLYDAAPCGYHSLGPDGTIVAVNRTELEMLGYKREEYVGRKLVDFMTPASAAIFRSRFQAFHQTGRVRDLEYEFVCRDGTVLPVLISADMVRGPNGEFLYNLATMVDNRERAAHERQIAEMQKELERRSEAAEAANRSKSAFLANMSHEIRTPMNAILGFVYLLEQSGLDSTQREQLGRIGTAGQHLMAIINDILDLSKIEAGALVLDHSNFSLRSVMDDVMALVGESARAKGLAMRLELDASLEWMRGDATRLRQCVLNFASNALKFTETGSITLRNRVLREDGDRALLRFEVQDTGPGIPGDRVAELFQPFRQLDVSTTRKFGGTGLGLAITRRLAGLMGGDAGVESEEGRGSTFWFTAWLERGRRTDSARNVDAAAMKQQIAARHAGARVLLAEDNRINQQVAMAILAGTGLKVDLATDGVDAIAKAAEPYDLILMDVHMPRQSGLDATRAIRRLPGHATTPILAMTADAFEDDRRRCFDVGMNGFITKPVAPALLYSTLLEWLDRKRNMAPDCGPDRPDGAGGQANDAGGQATDRPGAIQ